jgi:hypothetical protein
VERLRLALREYPDQRLKPCCGDQKALQTSRAEGLGLEGGGGCLAAQESS